MLTTAISSAGFTGLTFISGVVVARLLGLDGRGQYGAIMFWAQFAIVFCTFSFSEGAAVCLRSDDRAKATALPTLLSLGALIFSAAFCFVILAQAAGILQADGVDPGLISIFVIAATGLALLTKSFIAVEASQLRFVTINQDRLFAPLFFCLILALMFVLGQRDLEWVLLAFLAAKIPVFALWVWRYRKDVLGHVDLTLAGRILRLGGKFHIAASLTLVSQQIDRLIIVAMWPADRLGYYFVAFSAAGAGMTMVTQAIGLTLLPSLAGTEHARRRDRLERVFRYTVICAVSLTVLIFVAAPVLIPLVFGEEFRGAVFYTQGLAIALAFMPLRSVVLEANRAVGHGRPGVEMAISSLAVFLAVYAATGFASAWSLFAAIGLSHIAAIAVGLRDPVRRGDFRVSHGLVPKFSDIAFLIREVRDYLPRPR